VDNGASTFCGIPTSMAVIHPSGWQALSATGSAQREIETLALLERALPDTFTVFHGVHWTRLQHGFSVYGEVDFVIIAPNARVMVIEQKSGFLQESADGLLKIYGTVKKPIAAQIARSMEGLQARFGQGHAGQRMALDYLLYCPDYAVRHPHMAGIEPRHIVDTARRSQLAAIIQTDLAAGEDDPVATAALCRFFEGVLELVPEVGAVCSQVQALYSRLSGGLATWGRQIELDPFRLRVVGTAGSGKTQLALAALGDSAAAGRRSLYLCFNRPLADHLTQLAPRESTVLTYHQLCDQVLRAQSVVPDFSHPDAFSRLEAGFAAADPGPAWLFDEILVDEGQDFAQHWVDPLLRLLRPGGRFWWLEDPMQNLYGRAPVTLPGSWATLRSDTNYRSPRDVLARINQLIGPRRALQAGSPLTGVGGVGGEILTYADTAGLLDQTKRAITHCIAQGFRREMVSVVTYRGREGSALTPFDALGPHRLRRFSGEYDLLGLPIHTDGEVTLDTVFRFKGRSSPAVVLTEVDFEVLDDDAIRRIFVGATRASMALVMVVSERAARTFLERLDA
jgi:hypothetical protein